MISLYSTYKTCNSKVADVRGMYVQCQRDCVEIPGLHCKCVALDKDIGVQGEVAVTIQSCSGRFCSMYRLILQVRWCEAGHFCCRNTDHLIMGIFEVHYFCL